MLNLEEIFIREPKNDLGYCNRLLALNEGQIKFCKEEKQFLIWKNPNWEIVDDSAIRTAFQKTSITYKEKVNDYYTPLIQKANTDQAREALIEERDEYLKHCSSVGKESTLKNLVNYLKGIEEIHISINKFDNNKNILVFKNGILDLRTLELREANPSDFNLKKVNYGYNKEAKANLWEKSLNEWFSNDKELIDWIQKALGYSLTGHTSEEIILFAYGSGCNGKSRLVNAIKNIFSEYSKSADFKSFESSMNRSEQNFDLAPLKGARFVIAAESDEDRKLDEARIKRITTIDEVICAKKYKDSFTYEPTYTIWLTINHLPNVAGTDNGIWRRIVPIPFLNSFENNKNKRLDEQLLEEAEGIINWIVNGAYKWFQQGLSDKPKALTSVKDKYRKDSDTILLFLLDMVALGKKEAFHSTDYINWAKENAMIPYGTKKFKSEMEAKGCIPFRTSTKNGLKFSNEIIELCKKEIDSKDSEFDQDFIGEQLTIPMEINF